MVAGYLQYYEVSSSPGSYCCNVSLCFSFDFFFKEWPQITAVTGVSNKFSLVLLAIENLPDYYEAYVAISQLCTLYPINDNELAVPLNLISKICEIYPNLSYRKAIKHYVDISLEKDKKNR